MKNIFVLLAITKKLLHDHTGKFKYLWLFYDYLPYNSNTEAYWTRLKQHGKHMPLNFRPYLMSPCERCVPVHVIFWLADINHLVGVQLEHALHLQLAAAVLRLVRGAFGHSLLLQLLPTSLALPYPSQIPKGQKRSRAMNNTDRRYRKFLDYTTHQKNTSLFFLFLFLKQKEISNFTWESFMVRFCAWQYLLVNFKA